MLALAADFKVGATVTITIPDDVLLSTRMSEAEIRRELAIALFAQEKLTLAQAARLSDLDRLSFQHLIASRGLTVHYGVAEFDEDLLTLRDLGRL